MRPAKDVLVMLSPVSQPRLAGIARCAKERGWHLVVRDRHRHLPDWRVDGVLATVRDRPDIVETVRAFRRKGVPVVDMTVEKPHLRLVRVTSDHVAIGRLAAEHFAERQFTHRAWFSSGWTNVHALRFKGFTEKYPAEKWIGTAPVGEAQKPLAVFAYDETDAAILLRECLAEGVSVPEEVSILSCGNDPLLCEMQPVPLSSIDQDLERGAYEAAVALDLLMRGKPVRQPLLIPPKLVELRRSTDVIAASDPILRSAFRYIRSHLTHSFGAEQIAAAVGVPRPKLDRLFSAEVGHSVGAEILHQRISHVKLLLKNTDLPAATIAAKAGFCTPSYLNNVFRRETGLTPRAWRKL